MGLTSLVASSDLLGLSRYLNKSTDRVRRIELLISGTDEAFDFAFAVSQEIVRQTNDGDCPFPRQASNGFASESQTDSELFWGQEFVVQHFGFRH